MKYIFPIPHCTEIKATTQPWELSITGAGQTRMAKRAEELGYDMLTVPEHFVIPREHVELSGAHYFHATAAQGYFAGATETIRLNTGITLLPLQHPILMAKGLSTIDWLSGGRIGVTFGVGWLDTEFEALGVPFHERGRMSDEFLEAIIELWTKEYATFEGKYVSFRDVALEPKPVQKPYLPVWMGGDSDGALKRIARFANGWYPYLTPADEFRNRIDFIKSQSTYGGQPLEVMYVLAAGLLSEGHVARNNPNAVATMAKQEPVDRMAYYKERGVTICAFSIPPVKDGEAYLDYAQWFIEEVKPNV